jgi:hypothetical protein
MDNTLKSPYAPVRLRDLGWWRYAQQAAKDGKITSRGMIAPQFPDEIWRDLVVPLARMASEAAQTADEKDAVGQLVAKAMQFRQWIPLIGQYEQCGKQIFDLDDALVTMLRMTDAEDCQLSAWNAPYDAFYVRFGKQHEMRLQFGPDEYEYLDGAFVAVTPWTQEGTQRRLKIGLCTVKEDGAGVQMPGYFVDLTPAEQELAPSQAVDAFIQRKFAELDADSQETPKYRDLNEIRKGEYKEGADLMKAAVSLVVNSLFYIESLGVNHPLTPGRDVPPAQVAQWHQAPATRKFKASQKITRDGYVMVHLLADPTAHEAGHQSEREGVATHWRRGHWRRQRYGPQNSLMKRVWLRPVMINPGDPDPDRPGHVYVVPGNSAVQ